LPGDPRNNNRAEAEYVATLFCFVFVLVFGAMEATPAAERNSGGARRVRVIFSLLSYCPPHFHGFITK